MAANSGLPPECFPQIRFAEQRRRLDNKLCWKTLGLLHGHPEFPGNHEIYAENINIFIIDADANSPWGDNLPPNGSDGPWGPPVALGPTSGRALINNRVVAVTQRFA